LGGRKQQDKIQKLEYMSQLFLLSKVEMAVKYPDEVKLKLAKALAPSAKNLAGKSN
jgi:hypothetical protein